MLEFGHFRLDPDRLILWRDDQPVPIGPRVVQTLAILVANPGQVFSKEELLEKVWGDTVVDESSVAHNILVLRKVLKDDSAAFVIENVPRRGYRFCELQRPERDMQLGSSTALQSRAVRRRKPLAVLLVVVLALIAAGLYWRPNRSQGLTEKDTIVLAGFVNHTGDAIFDDTLKQALSIALRQSPFLNILSEEKVADTLKLMARPTDTVLTPEVAREVCERANSKAYVAGSIASLGSEYVLGLQAVNCRSGDMLAQQQTKAASKEQVLDALGEAATDLRSHLGESLATVQKFDVPLAQATTTSLDALKAYSLGQKMYAEKGPLAGLPFQQRAIQFDPNFAVAYVALANDYFALGELRKARECSTKAFQLRDRASEREKLEIAASYHWDVTGELDKAAENYEEQIESYPRDSAVYANLGILYAQQGQYDKAADMTRQAVHAFPDNVMMYLNLTNILMAVQRFDEARQTIQQAQARRLDDFTLHQDAYALAFVTQDHQSMSEQAAWLESKPAYKAFGLWLESETEAYAGHLDRARDLTRRAMTLTMRGDSKENASIGLGSTALREAALGYEDAARRAVQEALKVDSTTQGTQIEAALALAMAGDVTRAQALVRDIDNRYPLDMQVQGVWLPTIRAQIALAKNDPVAAIRYLQGAAVMELGSISFGANPSCLYPIYVRGQAYLAAGSGSAAAGEFQKILDHSGMVWNCVTGAVARLGLARAQVMMGDKAAARKSYQDFLTLWKDADPDIPIYKQAKAEYAKLGQ